MSSITQQNQASDPASVVDPASLADLASEGGMDVRTTSADPGATPAANPDEAPPGFRGTGMVAVRYWAGARAAAQTRQDTLPAGSVAEILATAVAARPALAPVVALCSILVDGLRSEADTVVPPGATLDVLPPFAGG